MRKALLSVLIFAAVLTGAARAGSAEFAAFNALSEEKKEKLAQKKARKDGIYYLCKVDNFNVNSDANATEAYWWGLLLGAYSRDTLEEGLFPKEPRRKGQLQVYVLKDREAYKNALQKMYGDAIDASWSGGMFIRQGNKTALMTFNYDTPDVLMKVMLHECTHQLIFYHINEEVPVWFNEGMATNMETYEIGLSMKANLYNAMYKNDRAIGAIVCLEKNLLTTFPDLFTMPDRVWLSATEDQAGYNYASAWAACNFIFTTKRGRKFVGKFIDATRKGGIEEAKNSISPADQRKINDMVREHISTVLKPCVIYGRKIRQLLNQGDKTKALELFEKMKKDFPDNEEMKFYQAWFDIEDNREPQKAADTIKDLLQKTDFFHPEVFYVTALGYHKAGKKALAQAELKTAQKTNPGHSLTIKLASEIKP